MTASDRPMPLWVGGIFLISFMALLLGIGLRIEGWSRARQEKTELEDWPLVTAQIQTCFLERHRPSYANRAVIFKIFCKFKYSVNGTEYQSSVETVGQRHAMTTGALLPEDAQRMENWARNRKKGSSQTVHYNPNNPMQISLAGADYEFRTDTAAIAFNGSNQSLFWGGIFFLLAVSAHVVVGNKK
jgi:hypothetical protein